MTITPEDLQRLSLDADFVAWSFGSENKLTIRLLFDDDVISETVTFIEPDGYMKADTWS